MRTHPRLARAAAIAMRVVLVMACGPLGAVAHGAGLEVVFDAGASSHRWSLAELSADLPRDWTPFASLVLEMRASSAQVFELRIHSGGAVRSMRLLPFEGALVRAAVPLDRYRQTAGGGHDLASVSNRPRTLFGTSGARNQGPLDDVTAVEVVMPRPVGRPSLEIRSVRLAKEDPGDALIEPKPLVDAFGQWISADWPGKARSLDDLRGAWAKEEQSLLAERSPACRFGGFEGTRAKATGFFRVEQVDGRWWLVDPDGHHFFSAGADVISPTQPTRVEGRAEVFAKPPAPATHRGRPGTVSFHSENLRLRLGDDWSDRWVDLTTRRMRSWGLNTIGSWSDARLWAAPRTPYTVILNGWGIETGVLGLPDVYADDWARRVDESTARQCAPRRDDPFLLGYFIGNEPAWPGREAFLAGQVMNGRDTPMKRALTAWLAAGDTPERRKAFVLHTFDRMLATVNAAIRKHDPNHLNLGIRFGGKPGDDVIKAARVFDVFSLNIYATAPEQSRLDAIARITGRPIVIGEFHIGTPGRGMSAGLVQARDQQQRGVAYRHYVENAAAHPSVVGTHWFQWVDEPNTGRFDGENYNIGLVDVTDQPYPALVEALRATHQTLLDVHAGRRQPTRIQAEAR